MKPMPPTHSSKSESKPHVSPLPPPSPPATPSTSNQSLASSLGPPVSFSSGTQSTQAISPTQSDIASILSSCNSQCPTSISSASTIQPHHSASNYDPAVARLKIPKKAVRELEKLVSRPPKPQVASADPDEQTPGMKIRFYASLMVLITCGLSGVYLHNYAHTSLGGIGYLLLAIFLGQWYGIYGASLTRQKRTYFDEKNVLETYKVYDREFGHLFQKEPDTPANCCPPPKLEDSNIHQSDPVKAVANDLLAQYQAPPKETAQFSQSLQDHYGNMYDNIRRVNDEIAAISEARKANAEADGRTPKDGKVQEEAPLVAYDPLVPHTKPGPLVPARIPLPGQSHDNNRYYGGKK